jgi:hypothetical protein
MYDSIFESDWRQKTWRITCKSFTNSPGSCARRMPRPPPPAVACNPIENLIMTVKTLLLCRDLKLSSWDLIPEHYLIRSSGEVVACVYIIMEVNSSKCTKWQTNQLYPTKKYVSKQEDPMSNLSSDTSSPYAKISGLSLQATVSLETTHVYHKIASVVSAYLDHYRKANFIS